MVKGKVIVMEESAECTREILEAKRQYILKMTSKLEDAFSAPKTYWNIINHLLYNKMIPAIPPLLVDGNFVSHFNKKADLFNNFFASICTPKKMQELCHIFPIEQTAE